jgi:hypothetical protein
LPNYNVIPNTRHEIYSIPGGGKEIFLPILVPSEQITLSYLYFPPTTYTDINIYVKSDEGFAQEIKVIPAPSFPSWAEGIMWILLFNLQLTKFSDT